MIFQTERLTIRSLHANDREAFYDMMSNPNVMHPIPQAVMDRTKSDLHFERHLNPSSDSRTKVWAIQLEDEAPFIGIAAYLKNNDDEDEIGYRLLEQFWGVGYGTEVTKGLIDYGFNQLELELLTADVNTSNERSSKILDKFFNRHGEFYNERDKCRDRRYKLTRKEWLDWSK